MGIQQIRIAIELTFLVFGLFSMFPQKIVALDQPALPLSINNGFLDEDCQNNVLQYLDSNISYSFYRLNSIRCDSLAVPFLVEAVGRNDIRSRYLAIYALGQLGVEANRVVPVLIEALEDNEHAIIRSSAADALGQFGTDAIDSVPILIQLLQPNEQDEVQISAINALEQIGAGSQEMAESLIEALIVALKDNDELVRGRAAYLLGQMDSPIQDALPLLIHALQYDTSLVRANAAYTIGQINPLPDETVLTLITVLQNQPDVSASTAYALRNFRASSLEFVDALVDVLEDGEGNSQLYAARLLGQVGIEQSDVISALSRAAEKQNDLSLRLIALDSLVRIGTNNPSVTQIFLTALTDSNEDDYIQIIAADAFKNTRPLDARAIPALIKLLDQSQEQNPDVRIIAASTLGKAETNLQDVVDGLLMALGDSDSDVRAVTADALGRLGRLDHPIIDALADTLSSDEDELVRLTSMTALEMLRDNGSIEANSRLHDLAHVITALRSNEALILLLEGDRGGALQIVDTIRGVVCRLLRRTDCTNNNR